MRHDPTRHSILCPRVSRAAWSMSRLQSLSRSTPRSRDARLVTRPMLFAIIGAALWMALLAGAMAAAQVRLTSTMSFTVFVFFQAHPVTRLAP